MIPEPSNMRCVLHVYIVIPEERFTWPSRIHLEQIL